MGKKLLAVLLLALSMAGSAFAARNSGYVYTIYGEIVKDPFGQCLRTAYFDPDNGLAECGDAVSQDSGSSSGN